MVRNVLLVGTLRLDEVSCPEACWGSILELCPRDADLFLSSGSFAVIWIATFFHGSNLQGGGGEILDMRSALPRLVGLVWAKVGRVQGRHPNFFLRERRLKINLITN